MNELEEYLDRVCRPLRGARSLRRHVREELREHLLEAAERHQADGSEPAEAVRKAIAEFGDPEMVREGLQDVYGRPVMAMLIEKAMAWKGKTMKTGWKWSFAAHLTLAMSLALGAAFLVSLGLLVIPPIFHDYALWDLPLPQFSRSVFGLLGGMLGTYLPIWLTIVVVAWGVFEWRCRSESKPIIRLTLAGLACLGVMVLVLLVSAAASLAYAVLPSGVAPRHRGELICRRAAEARVSFARLSEAVENQDWPAARGSARALHRKLKFLHATGLAAWVLVGAEGSKDASRVSLLLKEVAERADDLRDGIRDGEDQAVLRLRFSRLRAAYEGMMDKVPHWPTHELASSTQPGGQ